GVMRRARGFVERERVVLPDDADLVRTVLVLDLLERRPDAAAEGALEVADLDDRDGCAGFAPDGVGCGDGHARCRMVGGAGGPFGLNLAALPLFDAPHEEHPSDEAEQEADDCGSLVHGLLLMFRNDGLNLWKTEGAARAGS